MSITHSYILDQFSRTSSRSLCVSMRRSRVDKRIKQLKSPTKSKQNEQIKIKNETVSTPSVTHFSLIQYKRINKKETSKKVKTKNSKKIAEGKTKSIVQKRVFSRVRGIVKSFKSFSTDLEFFSGVVLYYNSLFLSLSLSDSLFLSLFFSIS